MTALAALVARVGVIAGVKAEPRVSSSVAPLTSAPVVCAASLVARSVADVAVLTENVPLPSSMVEVFRWC